MKTKILVVVGLIVLLGTGLYAYNHGSMDSVFCTTKNENHMVKKEHSNSAHH